MLACAAVAVGMSWHSQYQFSDVALANIEALASGEGAVRVPCKRIEACECSFFIYDADGNLGIDTWNDYIYVEIGYDF